MTPQLPNVSRVITQGRAPQPGGFCGNPHVEWDQFCKDLESFALQCESARGIHMLHLSRPWRNVDCWKERLRDDWLDRVEGRNGCWVESEEEEAGREIYEEGMTSETIAHSNPLPLK
ncbi:hypothetical protein C8Q76DRAFT_794672 [Earliella scabrosa]|nr:hypothetical protein C8Q76DRAFT_794672 [Earliella scabrosa]